MAEDDDRGPRKDPKKAAKSIRDAMLDDQTRISDTTLLQLATSDTGSTLTDDLLSRDIPTQLRAFMLAKAKGDLVRVLKLSSALGDLEDTFIERAISEKDETSLKNLQKMIETTSGALDRTNEFIQTVMGDNGIQLTIDQSTNIYNDNTTTNNTNNFVSVLADQNSRQKLRDIAAKLLSPISTNQADIVNSQVIDSDDIEDVSEDKESDH